MAHASVEGSGARAPGVAGDAGRARGQRRSAWLWPLLVGGVALGLTAGLWQHERQSQARDLRSNFDFALRQASHRIEQRMTSYEQMLRGLRGLFDASDEVTRTDFETYVELLQSGADFAGLRAMGHATLRRGGDAGGAPRPSAPVDHLAPAQSGATTPPGRDLLADPRLRDAMLQAADSGAAVLTPALPPDEDGAGAGLLMFMPLYGKGPPPVGLQQRRARLVGWVYAAFRVPDLMSSLYGEGTPGLDLRVHDGVGADAATLLHPPRLPADADRPARLDAQEFIAVAGHTWTLRVRSTPAFLQLQGNDTAAVIAVAGGGLSAVLALLTWLLATSRDRARHAAESMTRQLRDSERGYRRIVETASEGIWVLDADGRIRFANPALASGLGWPAEALVGRPWTEFMDPASQARVAGLDLSREPRGPADRLELCLQRHDGSALWASVSTTPIVDEQGRPGGVLAMVTDVSERQRAEARRAALEAQLHQAQKMEAIGTLAGGIAHDFNNILAAILGNAALLEQELDAGHPARPRLAQITQAGQRARSLVQQIVAFSRQQPVLRLPQPLRPVLEEAVRLLRSTLPARAELSLDLATEPLVVDTDATQLQQVLMNLCTNAWHALPEGAGHIAIGLAPATPDPATAERLGLPPGPCARLWVRDDGCGMDEATRQRIFEPFFTTKPVGQGTGLGLAVVHGIVRAHGGAVRVDSAPGRGSRFEILLPLSRAAPRPADDPSPPPAASPPGHGEHVLYIDDDPVMALMVEGLLQRLGYRVSCLQDPRQGLARALDDGAAVDVVVTDFNMPELSGLELARQLARLRPALPVLISSGHVTDALRQNAERAGVCRVLQKEYTLERLGPLLHEVLAARAPAPSAAG